MPPRIPGPKPRGSVDLLDLLLPGLTGWIQDAPILGDLFEIITGKEDADKNDFGSFINGIIHGVQAAALGAAFTSVFPALNSMFDALKTQAQKQEDAIDAAKTQAQGALDAAANANLSVKNLAQGGVRTIYTSDTQYIPPAGLLKVQAIMFAGGSRGGFPTSNSYSSGGYPGSYAWVEVPGNQIPPEGWAIKVGPGSPNSSTASLSKFGPFDSSAGGIVQGSTVIPVAGGVTPGFGGNSSANGLNGFSTLLAAGGVAPGGAGGNAPVDGQYLAGGGGGAGGMQSTSLFGPATNGGAGGFPGGGGGGAGRNQNEAYWVPGAGAPGLVAVIEFKAAA